ncbi:MAG: GSCFA domain-containing protein [Bacteroidales bacterium]|jgi:hypothetical protein|nr:GSCFA domain-containing protein [Bacteroidales bacterium]
MEFRTTFRIPPSSSKITYNDPVMFIGSCFATSIGKQFEAGHMPVMINPSGTVYNPVSVSNTLQTITSGKIYKKEDLHYYNGLWLSFDHYTDFSSEDAEQTISKINNQTGIAGKFLAGAHFLFITFGTARVFRWNRTGKIVSNCHKIPAAEFTHELLSVNDAVSLWNDQLQRLHSLYPALKVVFTISPVRHWKDSAHGNQVSKSVLFLTIEELLKHPSCPGYFPAYELLMDDLRDYRFYDDDLLHPSAEAVGYIWDAFSECWFDTKTSELWKEVNKITKALSHRIAPDAGREIKIFAGRMISAIDKIYTEHSGLNLEKERNYFLDLLQV